MFSHTIRARYAEVDMQGVVFNAHWLTYFDETSVRFFESLGFGAQETFAAGGAFDAMVIKAVLEWQGPARFDDAIEIRARPERIGGSSFDIRYSAFVDGRPACEGLITYVSTVHGSARSTPIPDILRARLTEAMEDVPAST